MNESYEMWQVKRLAWKKKLKKYRQDVVSYQLFTQREFSVHNALVFFVYGIFCFIWNHSYKGIPITGSILCMVVALYSLAGYAANRLFLQKHIKYVVAVTNIYILILAKLLFSIDLVWNDGKGGNISWTLLTCSILTTAMMSIVPTHYAFTILGVAALDTVECIAIGGGAEAILDNLLDAVIVSMFAIGINVIYSGHKYEEFGRKEELKLESSRDTLTNLYNRRYIEGYFGIYSKPENLSAIIMLDLDNFKMANDLYGHKKGDEVLCTVSEILRRSFRDEDCVARLGGDEFAVFLPKVSSREAVIERIRTVLGRFPIILDEEGINLVSVSIGIAYKNPGEQIDYTKLCNKADEAMYRAKRLGKGKAVVSADRNLKETVIVA